MCRFLLIKSKEEKDMRGNLSDFAQMAEKSRTKDGDRQKDGWGAAWHDGEDWQLMKSLNPIWEETERFSEVPETRLLLAHARSASFDKSKGIIDYNEPYVERAYAFVFNGLLKGVGLKRKVEGDIGAQKIWTLLLENLEENSPEKALEDVKRLLQENTREIKGLNIGLSDGEKIYALCGPNKNEDYFTLRAMSIDGLSMISSQEFGDFEFNRIKQGELIAF